MQSVVERTDGAAIVLSIFDALDSFLDFFVRHAEHA